MQFFQFIPLKKTEKYSQLFSTLIIIIIIMIIINGVYLVENKIVKRISEGLCD